MLLFNPRLDTICEGPGQERQIQRLTEIFGDREKGRPLSPVHNVKPGNPPALIMHGTADDRLEVDHMRRFQTAMHNAENRCELELYEGAGHGFFHYRDGNNPWFYETMQAVDQFLVSLDYIQDEEQTASFNYTFPKNLKAHRLSPPSSQEGDRGRSHYRNPYAKKAWLYFTVSYEKWVKKSDF